MTLNHDTSWNSKTNLGSFTDLKESGIMTKSGFLSKTSKGSLPSQSLFPFSPQTTLPTSGNNKSLVSALICHFLSCSCIKTTFSSLFLFYLKIKSLTCRWWGRRLAWQAPTLSDNPWPRDGSACHVTDRTTAEHAYFWRYFFILWDVTVDKQYFSITWSNGRWRGQKELAWACLSHSAANPARVTMSFRVDLEAFKRCRYTNAAKTFGFQFPTANHWSDVWRGQHEW